MALMMSIMLCGASDVRYYRDAFRQVVREIGGEPWSYLDATIEYINAGGASFATNSVNSAQSADLCVFVINETYGELTWQSEMRTVVDSGKPFIVLALSEVLNDYHAMVRRMPDFDKLDEKGDRRLFLAIREAEKNQSMIVPFGIHEFPDKLRESLGSLLKQGVGAIWRQQEDAKRMAALKAETDATLSQLALAIGDVEVAKRAAKDSRDEAAASARSVAHASSEASRLGAKCEELLTDNRQLNSDLANRRSLPYKLMGGVALFALVLGGMAGNSLAGPASSPSASAGAPSATPTVKGTLLPDPPASSFSETNCAPGKSIALLGQYGDEAKADYRRRTLAERIVALQREDAVMGTEKEYPQVMMSRKDASCRPTFLDAWGLETPVEGVFLWMGPFDKESLADTACGNLKLQDMDCFSQQVSG